ncbi:MAG: low molecular weight protein-tyrosine-phosphatase [Bacilli bacterium]
MKKILFICEGNICRSPTAEFICRELLSKANLAHKYEVYSRASRIDYAPHEVYAKSIAILEEHHIPVDKSKVSKTITFAEFAEATYVIVMEKYNIICLKRLLLIKDDSKISLLTDYTNSTSKDIPDPYPNGDFKKTYDEIYQGVEGFINFLINKRTS